jgi:hypothetical protein
MNEILDLVELRNRSTTSHHQLINKIIQNLTQIECEKERSISTNLQDLLDILNSIGLMVIVIGILLNTLNLVVLLRTKLPESPYTYLTSLAFTDLGALITHLTAKIVNISVKQDRHIVQNLHLYLIIPLINTFLSCSMYTTLALTCERFVFVHSPLKAISVCRKSLARKVCVTIFVFTILKSAYLPFMYKKSRCHDGGLEQYSSKILDVLEFLVGLAIPYAIIFVINLSLIFSLRRSGKSSFNKDQQASAANTKHLVVINDVCDYRRTYNEKEHRNQRKLTISLILILCLLLICHLPSFLLEESLVEAVFGDYNTTESAFLVHVIGTKVSIILTYINCSANFIIYCASNKKFFTSLKTLVLSVIRRNKKENSARRSYKYSTRSSKISVNSSSLNKYHKWFQRKDNFDYLHDSKF